MVAAPLGGRFAEERQKTAGEAAFVRERAAGGASAAKMIRAYLALWRATGEPELLAKARMLGDTVTRVQTPEGRIPTFWTHDTLGEPLYDWLNCMEAAADALLSLADATDRGPAAD